MIHGLGDHNPIMATGHDGDINMQVLYILWLIATPFIAAFSAAMIVFTFYNPKHVAFCVVGLLAKTWVGVFRRWPNPRIIALLIKFQPKGPSR